MRAPLRKLGLYFGLVEPTEAERREERAAEDLELARPLSRVLAGVALAAVIHGVVFGFGVMLLEGGGYEVGAAIFFGAGMGAFYLWQALNARAKARERQERRST